MSFFEGFEDGDVTEWDNLNVSTFSATSNKANTGVYSGYLSQTDNQNGPKRTPYPNGHQIDEFIFYFQETSSQNGGAVKLVNSNGDIEMGFATANSQQQVHDSSGFTEMNSGFGYNTWVRVRVVFDWSNNNFTVYTQGGGQSDSQSFNLRQGVDFATVIIADYNYYGYSGGGGWDMWFDDFEVVGGPVQVTYGSVRDTNNATNKSNSGAINTI